MQCVRVSEQNRTLIWIAFTLGNPTSKAIRGSSLIYWHARFSSVCKLAESRSKLTIFDKTLKHFGKFPSFFLLFPLPFAMLLWTRNFAITSTLLSKGKCMGVSRIFGEESRLNYQWALGTGDYLSPGRGGGGGGSEDFGGINWFLGEQKGRSVVTENPKGRITENFGRIQRGTTQICLHGKWRRGGIVKVILCY